VDKESEMDRDPLPQHNFHHYRYKEGIWGISVGGHKLWIVLRNFPWDIGREHRTDMEEDQDIDQQTTHNDHQDRESEPMMDRLAVKDKE
jgi:hypothetical protein